MGPAAAPRIEKPANASPTASAHIASTRLCTRTPPVHREGWSGLFVLWPSRHREHRPGIRLWPIGHPDPGDSMVSSQSLAKSIVKESLRPKEDEVVLISTYPHTIDLAEQ